MLWKWIIDVLLLLKKQNSLDTRIYVIKNIVYYVQTGSMQLNVQHW